MDFAFDKNGDITIKEDGDIDLNSSVSQKIRTAILWFSGEWKWDVDRGVPYLDYLFVKNPDVTHIESLIREQIFNVPEVVDVEDVTLTYDKHHRRATVKFTASTDTEIIKEEVELNV